MFPGSIIWDGVIRTEDGILKSMDATWLLMALWCSSVLIPTLQPPLSRVSPLSLQSVNEPPLLSLLGSDHSWPSLFLYQTCHGEESSTLTPRAALITGHIFGAAPLFLSAPAP